MDKDVIEIAILTAFGKANLANINIPLYKNHPAVINYRNMRFINKEPSIGQLLAKDSVANNPNVWFNYLKDKKKFTELHLIYEPEMKIKLKTQNKHLFDGKGTPWYILAGKDSKYDIWKVKWQPEHGETISYYYLFAEGIDIEKISSLSLETTSRFLKVILKELIEFTHRNKLDNWMKIFQAALDTFDIKNPRELLSAEYLPADCYSLEAKQILIVCDQAWVFGGMGSWNDVVQVDNYDVYRRLTDNLYDTLNNSVAAAINSYP